MIYRVELTEEALVMLEEIADRWVRAKLFERIGKLAVAPASQGKSLVKELAGLRSVRAIGQRYRILYEVQEQIIKVLVVGVGLRKAGHRTDVYARLASLFRK